MAEIATQSRKGGRSAVQPRIDLTPMVDLGFLLITFFMMTTTMSKPKAMDIQMPYKGPEQAPPDAYLASSAITLMPAKDHHIYYYEGEYTPGTRLQEVHTEAALRSLLTGKQKALQQRDNPRERSLQVLIKSHPDATVKDIIDLFDEMRVLQVKYYAMVDMYPGEQQLIDREQGQ